MCSYNGHGGVCPRSHVARAADRASRCGTRAGADTRNKAGEVVAFREALEAMTLKDRRAALIQHYGLLPEKDGKYALPEEKKWENAKEGNPTPEKFRAWLDVVFPDRQEIGLLVSDLEKHDPPAHRKIYNWPVADAGARRDMIESFGLRLGVTKYDATQDAALASRPLGPFTQRYVMRHRSPQNLGSPPGARSCQLRRPSANLWWPSEGPDEHH
jgi:hypothetical protein